MTVSAFRRLHRRGREVVEYRRRRSDPTATAYDSGFADLSNFNRTFRAEFGATPRAYRRTVRYR